MTNLSDEEIGALTQARTERVRPIVQELKKLLVEKNVLLSDLPYIEAYAKQELNIMLSGIVFQHFNEIFNILQADLELAVNNAQSALWGKDKDDVTVKDVDLALKKKIPKEK